jgi:hypothetical protein
MSYLSSFVEEFCQRNVNIQGILLQQFFKHKYIYIYIYISLWVWLQNDESQWHIFFYITSAIYFTGNLFFVLFGKGEIQPWNDPHAPSKWMQPAMYIIITIRMQAILVISNSNICLSLPEPFSQKHHTTPLWLPANGHEYIQFLNFVWHLRIKCWRAFKLEHTKWKWFNTLRTGIFSSIFIINH